MGLVEPDPATWCRWTLEIEFDDLGTQAEHGCDPFPNDEASSLVAFLHKKWDIPTEDFIDLVIFTTDKVKIYCDSIAEFNGAFNWALSMAIPKKVTLTRNEDR